MKRTIIASFFLVLFLGSSVNFADARSGCCSHHGGVSGCGCADGTSLSTTCAPYYPECSAPTYQAPTPIVIPSLNKQSGTSSADSFFVGKPKTFSQLYQCLIVGNNTSKIYHLKGSKYITEMNLKGKECFGTQAAAIKKGYRKAKVG